MTGDYLMLKDIIDAKDINGNDVFRKSFENNVNAFKADTRKRAKQFTLEHHEVVNLHGGRYLACVKRDSDAMLIETNAKGKDLVVVAVMCTSIYSKALAEGIAQIKAYVATYGRTRTAEKVKAAE